MISRINSSRQIGLARALSKLGYCSRTQASALIREGRVRLNDRVRLDPETPVDLEKDRIELDGAVIQSREKTYLLLNKPRGVVTTASDEKGRKTVYDCLDEQLSWLAPVGRLDKASEGLLLFTNDSEWAARLLAPESHVDKTYHVQINAVVKEDLARTLEKGVRISGELFRVSRASILRQGQRNTWLEIILDEGKNRHIRRMMEELGFEVLRLVRVAIGPLVLGKLAKGASRELTKEEKFALDQLL